MRRLRRLPGPLAILLVVATIQALAWIVLMPPLQGPDEVGHFTYVQRIYEDRTIPWMPRGGDVSTSAAPYSEEMRGALGAAGFAPLMGNVAARPLWTRVDERYWNAASRGASRDSSGYTPTLRNPPVYYVYEVVPYAVGSGGTLWDRSILMRAWNIPLLLAAVVFIWLLAGEMLGSGPLRFLATAVAASVPQLSNVVATVNPDTALVAEWSAALWVMALVWRRGLNTRLLVWLAVLNVAAVLTQPRSVTLVLPSLLLVLLVMARERGWRRVTPGRTGAVTAGALLLVAFAWASAGSGTVRQFASYLWQFYLPRLGFMNGTIGPATYDVHSAFLGRLVGGFAELEVGLPQTPDTVVWWAVRLGLLGLCVALVLKRDAVRRRAGLAVVFSMALFTTILGLHLVAYRSLLGNPNDPIITGRYLLPFAGLLGVAVALVAYAFPRPVRPVYSGLVLAAMVALQLMSLGLLLGRFYG